MDKGYVDKSAAFIVAPRRFPFGRADNIKKPRKPIPLDAAVEIPTGVFQDGKRGGLSALVCSQVDAVNRCGELEGEYQLVPNLHADAHLPPSFRIRATYCALSKPATNTRWRRRKSACQREAKRRYDDDLYAVRTHLLL